MLRPIVTNYCELNRNGDFQKLYGTAAELKLTTFCGVYADAFKHNNNIELHPAILMRGKIIASYYVIV
ncbi:hypothetical protein [Clostridium arbusti]|uniref:hypothetical protein n=1 Tax=Clostridium arbusti TaxID=1137848 RepID=UPI00028A2BC0|nr:hypothetical protein [Clostridium arbusti]